MANKHDYMDQKQIDCGERTGHEMTLQPWCEHCGVTLSTLSFLRQSEESARRFAREQNPYGARLY